MRGRVLLDGKPLAIAAIVFTPCEDGRQSTGLTDKDGIYELTYLRQVKGAKVGMHSVAITTANERSPQERLPECYHSRTTLQADVKAGKNQCDFSLEMQP